MTNGHNNPNELPDDDWAMSEPEVPVKKETQAKPIDERAASLYAPPDTGDLDGWDIAPQTAEMSGEAVPPPPSSPPQNFSEPTAFAPPQNAFEILKPVAPPKFKDDWGMSNLNPRNDGWEMPEPTFRKTDGEILTKVRKSSTNPPNAVLPHSAEEQERMSGIYAPPDTQETITEEFELGATSNETAEQSAVGEVLPNAAPLPASTQAEAKPKKRNLFFVVLVFLFVGLVTFILLAAGFGLFFYKDSLMK